MSVSRPEWRPSEAACCISKASTTSGARRVREELASQLPLQTNMLKLIGSYALARLLGFGLLGAVVIYALISLLS